MQALDEAQIPGGRVRGFWEYDPDQGKVLTWLFDPPAKPVRAAVDAAATETSTFLREQVGHGRSFTLDSDDELRRRCAQLRALGKAR